MRGGVFEGGRSLVVSLLSHETGLLLLSALCSSLLLFRTTGSRRAPQQAMGVEPEIGT